MAASDAEHDYVHQIIRGLSAKYHVIADVMNFWAWEVTAHDRQEVLPLLNRFLVREVDLYVVQLGENAGNNIGTMDGDFRTLLATLREQSPQARIVVFGGFWANKKLDQIKESVCRETGATYISLQDIQSANYQSSMGMVVQDGNGHEHNIEHEGVSRHPNDKGMTQMAQKLWSSLCIPG